MRSGLPGPCQIVCIGALLTAGCGHTRTTGGSAGQAEVNEAAPFAMLALPVVTFNLAGTSRVRTAQTFLQKTIVGKRRIQGEDGAPVDVPLTKLEAVKRTPAFGEFLLIDVNFSTSGPTGALLRASSCQLLSGHNSEVLFLWGDVEGVTGFAGIRSYDDPNIGGFEIPSAGTVRKRFLTEYTPNLDATLQLQCNENMQVTLIP